jgi:hypothetical protein
MRILTLLVLCLPLAALAEDPPIKLEGMHAFRWGPKGGNGKCKKITPAEAATLKPWKCEWTDTGSGPRAVACKSPDEKRGLLAFANAKDCTEERETQEANAP